MRIKCDKIDVDSSNGILDINILGFDCYLFWLLNSKKDFNKILNEIPIEELEEYILKRKEENEQNIK